MYQKTFGSGTIGLPFTATPITFGDLNTVFTELSNVVTMSGLTLNSAVLDQVYLAIVAIVNNAVTVESTRAESVEAALVRRNELFNPIATSAQVGGADGVVATATVNFVAPCAGTLMASGSRVVAQTDTVQNYAYLYINGTVVSSDRSFLPMSHNWSQACVAGPVSATYTTVANGTTCTSHVTLLFIPNP